MRLKDRIAKSVRLRNGVFFGGVALIVCVALVCFPYINGVLENTIRLSSEMSFISKSDNEDNEEIYNDDGDPYVEPVIPMEDNHVSDDMLYEDTQEETAETTNPITSLPLVRPENAGNITKKTYVASAATNFINIGSGFLKNCTSLSNGEILEISKQAPPFKILADGSPEVLIMHTHTTESYQEGDYDWFDKGYSARTTNNAKNMVRVGDEIVKQLEQVGVGVIHDATLHDYPSYNGAYERSAVTVKAILKENPSIKVVLDIHRDAIQPDSDNIVAPVTTIDGRTAAQVMIIAGCENGKLGLPNFKENLKFATALQRQLATDYEALARPILFDYRKYNQDLTTGSLLLEMGGHANTLDEAIYCGELVGKSLAETLLKLK